MNDGLDFGKIIINDILELCEEDKKHGVKNIDFTRIWCDFALLPIYRIEYFIKTSLHTHKGYDKNEAVVYGQLMRIYRMLCFQRRLTCKRVMTTELAGFFERIIIEDSINLQYYILNYNNDSVLDDFRVHSLRPEAFFEETICDDIAENNGQITEWQKKLLDSIHSTYNKTGLTGISFKEIKEAKIKTLPIWKKFLATGNQRLYNIVYRAKSHSIHGDWVDFTLNYLCYNEDTLTFSPNFQEFQADIRQLNPALLVCYESLKKFLESFPGHGLPQDLYTEISDDQNLLLLLDDMHANFLSNRRLLDGIDIDKYDVFGNDKCTSSILVCPPCAVGSMM